MLGQVAPGSPPPKKETYWDAKFLQADALPVS